MESATKAAGGAVSVSLLGELRVCSAERGSELVLGRRAAIAFARIAVAEGAPVSREALADALWGLSPPASWRGSLRNVVAELRRALAAGGVAGSVALQATDGGYSLRLPHGSTVDYPLLCEEAERAARALRCDASDESLSRAETVRRLAEQRLLAGAQSDWVEGLRGELEAIRVELGMLCGEGALELGDPSAAARLARGVLAESALREDAHRLLIRALRAAGRRAEALAAYDACRRLLGEELGALPAPATQELFTQMLAEERAELPAALAGAERSPVAGVLLRTAEASPFVGRERLIAALRSSLALCGQAGTFVAAISGEPGLGKTRLAAELAKIAHREGFGTLYGRAQDRVGLPYAALVDALEQAIATVEDSDLESFLEGEPELGGVLRALIPSLRPRAAAAPPTSVLDPERIRHALLALLRLLAGRGALLVLDDMHWASRGELDVLAELLSDPEAAPLLVLVLHRHPDDDAALQAAGAHPRMERHELEPLSLQEALRLGELALFERGPLEGEQDRVQHERHARAAWIAGGGNPLLVSELLAQPDVHGRERLASVGGLVRERLEGLPEGAVEVLRLAAVFGVEFDAEVVCGASASGPARAAELLAAARRSRLLVAVDEPGARFAFRHGLVRDALLARLDPQERARLHERLGVSLEARSAPDARGFATLAHHFAAAGPFGGWRRALRYALPVARRAHEAGIHEDVITLATRALQSLAHAGDPEPGARLELEILLGAAQRALGDPRGHDTLDRAFESARERGDSARMADAALAAAAGALSESLSIDDRLLERYELALVALPVADRDRRARLLARVAAAHAWRRSIPRGGAVAGEAEALARELGDERTLAVVLGTVRLSLVGAEDVVRMRLLEDELTGLAERNEDVGLYASACLWRFASSVHRGEGGELESMLAEAADRVRALREGNLHHALAYEHASLALLRGRVAEAEALVARAAAIGLERGLDPSVGESIRLAQLMLVRGEQRREAELRAEATLYEFAGVTSWSAATAILDCAGGRLDGVAERVDALLDDYERDGPTILAPGGAIAYYAATVIRLGEPDRASRVRELILPFAGQGAYIAGFGGPIDYHLGLLEQFLEMRESARARFAAAEDFCRRLGAPRWQARAAAAGQHCTAADAR